MSNYLFKNLKLALLALSLSISYSAFATDDTNSTSNSNNNEVEKTQEDVDKRLSLKDGDTVYVSDQNIVWARRGPTTNHKIVGAKKIGDKLIYKGISPDKKYMFLEDTDGSTFWMAYDSIQVDPSGYHKYQILEDRIKELEYTLENYDTELSKRLKTAESKLSRLEKENKGMKTAIIAKDATITEYDEKIREYSDKLQTRELDMQMRWWTQGGILVSVGVLIGIVLIYLPRPGKKKVRKY